MEYLRADLVLPDKLLSEVQKYVQSGLLYIPKSKELHKKWGENSGSRELLRQRNNEIRSKFRHEICIDKLADEYYLSVETIKKIVYKK